MLGTGPLATGAYRWGPCSVRRWWLPHLTSDARCWVLVQTDDELVPTALALGLFRSIGSQDKRLHAHPGAHSAVPIEEIEASEAFIARHLI